MCHVEPSTLYVTLASTSPGKPFDAPSGSWIEKVMESSVTSVTFHSRYDQLFVPLCRVFPPSFTSSSYVSPSRVNSALPMRLA